MKTTNILLGAGFLVGGYLMIDYFSKPKTLVTQLETGDFVGVEPLKKGDPYYDLTSKQGLAELKALRVTNNDFAPMKAEDFVDIEEMKSNPQLMDLLGSLDWSTVDLDKINKP
jgi:hypothetical protein